MPSEKLRILLLEDNDDDTLLIQDLLKSNPQADALLSMERVKTLDSAITALKSTDFDMVITDLYLPDSRGVATFRRVHHAAPSLPIIVLSGIDNDGMERLAVQLGAQDYLVKGEFNAESLLRRIIYALERHRVEEKYRHLFEYSSDGIVLFYVDGHIFDMNKKTTVLFDYEPMEFLQLNFLSLFSQEHVEAGRGFMDRASAHHFANQELCFLKNDGSHFIAEVSASLLHLGDRPIIQALIRDVSERKKLDEMKDEFIGIAAHELRTPIATLRTAIANMTEGIAGPLTEKQATVLKIAQKNVYRVTAIINCLLDLSRLESGNVEPFIQAVPVEKLLNDTVVLFQEEMERRGLTLRLTNCEDLYVQCDASLLHQVMNNLFSNAVRYARKLIEINASVVNVGAHKEVCVRISNDGPPLSSEAQSRIFEKFVRLESFVDELGQQGTGLGLAICREILKLHGSNIHIESHEDSTTQFYFTLKQAVNKK